MKLKTINIKGKEYVPVNERIKAFQEIYKKGSIVVEVVHQSDSNILMRAKVFPDASDQLRYFTGYAFEKNSGGMVNNTSHVENCETSAVGRALGFLGIGVETSIATADEVNHAIKQQEAPKKTRVYTYNGKKYPHVTDIITPDSLPIPDWHMAVGTEIDLFMKAFFTKVPYKVKDDNMCVEAKANLKECVEAAQSWLMTFGTDMDMQNLDTKILNPDDVFVGTEDMEAIYNNMYSVVDFKKSKNLTKALKDKYFMQMAAYAMSPRFDKAQREKVEQLVIASPFNDPVCVCYPDIEKYYKMFLEKRAAYKERFKV